MPSDGEDADQIVNSSRLIRMSSEVDKARTDTMLTLKCSLSQTINSLGKTEARFVTTWEGWYMRKPRRQGLMLLFLLYWIFISATAKRISNVQHYDWWRVHVSQLLTRWNRGRTLAKLCNILQGCFEVNLQQPTWKSCSWWAAGNKRWLSILGIQNQDPEKRIIRRPNIRLEQRALSSFLVWPNYSSVSIFITQLLLSLIG
jgi:hypothetical protein